MYTYLAQENGSEIALEDGVTLLVLNKLTTANDFVTGLNNAANTGIGSRNPKNIGLNKSTNTKVGTRLK